MPSLYELAHDEAERPMLALVTKVTLRLIFSFLLILLVVSMGMKPHVLLNTTTELFIDCGYETVETYLFISSATAAPGFVGGLIAAPCPEGRTREDWRNSGIRFATSVLFWTLAFYWLSAFVLIAMVWSTASEVEELVPFYPGFYAGFTSNCANGDNLNNLALAIGMFKVETFVMMFGLIFGCPCFCLCFFVLEREQL